VAAADIVRFVTAPTPADARNAVAAAVGADSPAVAELERRLVVAGPPPSAAPAAPVVEDDDEPPYDRRAR